MYAQLVLRSGKHSGRKLTMQRRKILLGSAADCDLRIRSHAVAPHHCALFVSSGALAIHNLVTHGKTYLNDEPIKGTRRLQSGDTLRIGPLMIEIQFDPTELAQRVPVTVPQDEQLERRTTVRSQSRHTWSESARAESGSVAPQVMPLRERSSNSDVRIDWSTLFNREQVGQVPRLHINRILVQLDGRRRVDLVTHQVTGECVLR